MEQNRSTAIEIDLLALLRYVWKRTVWIAAVTVVFGLAGLLWNSLFVTPTYTAATRIFVLNRTNSNAIVSSDYQISNYMISDYRELIKGRNLTAEVIDRLDLAMSSDALSAKISVSVPDNTRFLQISVTDTEPERAARIADAVREVAITQLTEIMKVDAAATVYAAAVPTSQSGPNVMRNAAAAAAVGCALALGVSAVAFVQDKVIRTEEDVQRWLGIATLGSIPDADSYKKANRR